MEVVKIDPKGTLRRTPKSPYWEYRVYVSGKGRLERTTKEKDLRKAKSVAAILFADFLRTTSPTLCTIGDLLDLVIRDQKKNARRAFDSHVSPIIELHLRPFFGGTRATSFSTSLWEMYRERKLSEDLEETTVNRHATVLLRAYKLGHSHEPPLVDRIPRIEKADETSHIRDVLPTEEQFSKILELLPIDLAEGCLVAGTYGWRKAEVYKHLLWENVDFSSRTMYLPVGKTKNSRPRKIYMTEEVYLILSRRKTERDSLYPSLPLCFYNSSNGRPYPDSMFYENWKKAVTLAGCPGLNPHDLRRFGVTTMISDLGLSEKTAMSISGHATSAMLKRYQIMRPDDLITASKNLEDFRRIGGKLGEIGGAGK